MSIIDPLFKNDTQPKEPEATNSGKDLNEKVSLARSESPIPPTQSLMKKFTLPVALITLPALTLAILPLIDTLLPSATIGHDGSVSSPGPWYEFASIVFTLILFISLFAIIPCFVTGIILLIKRLGNNSAAPRVDTPNFDTSPHKTRSVTKIVFTSITFILMWVLIPLGFLVIALLEGFAAAMNGSGCQQNPTADYCQPSHIGIYFSIYLVIAVFITAATVIKKLK